MVCWFNSDVSVWCLLYLWSWQGCGWSCWYSLSLSISGVFSSGCRNLKPKKKEEKTLLFWDFNWWTKEPIFPNTVIWINNLDPYLFRSQYTLLDFQGTSLLLVCLCPPCKFLRVVFFFFLTIIEFGRICCLSYSFHNFIDNDFFFWFFFFSLVI